MTTPDTLTIADRVFHSRLLVGTGKYRDFEQTREAIEASGTEIVTVAIRRTRCAGFQCSRRSATTRVTPAWPSMPIFTASTRTSANSVSIWAATNSGGTGEMPVTARVFCAVSAAITAMP